MTDTSVSVKTGVTRGPESWAYIYVFLGFAITIEGSIIQMLQLPPFWAVISYAVVGFVTAWAFLDNAWFQNELIKMKIRYETKTR